MGGTYEGGGGGDEYMIPVLGLSFCITPGVLLMCTSLNYACVHTHSVVPRVQVLQVDASCVEAIACLASHHFYSDQPEVALQYFQRLAQVNLSPTYTLVSRTHTNPN